MTKEPNWDTIPGPSLQPDRPQRKRSVGVLNPVVALAMFASTSFPVNVGILGTGSLVDPARGAGFSRVPFYAKEILDKCAALKELRA